MHVRTRGRRRGQLGDGATVRETIPKEVRGPLVGRRIKMISAGDCHSMALTQDGCVFAWGSGSCGQIGHGGYEDVLEPVQIGGALTGRRVREISAGGEHSLALIDDGRACAWGSQEYGQLGAGVFGGWQLEPTEVAIPTHSSTSEPTSTVLRFRTLSAGGLHSLAASEDGKVFAWGNANHGQLGQGHREALPVPTAVAGALVDQRVTAVAAGGDHSVVLTDCGQVLSWGSGECGQLGHGVEEDLLLPRMLERLHATQVAAGALHTGVLTAEGKVEACV